ncbi:reticulon-2a isoform X2 [Thalassophryne amazonica]|uniref:reticulon-2a isoform X2 n=1 Tax=Thalassophryne amazonica TaxID=390379 RepID=UPI0014719C96|nr:reticulon-2a isoform X2 [Thalassophryne amazonica]
MGQVLGFSHCQEYGSVASTPDSTPPCTDGRNEESEMYELQTAREWSEDEGGDGGPDDEEALASSPSIWGTPRQNSFELTFSYIAIAEAEAAGASRLLRERHRGSSRGSRSPLSHADTLETLLDSPDVDWDPQGFISHEEEEDALERRERDEVEEAENVESGQDRQSETIRIQPLSPNLDQEPQERDTGTQRQTQSSQPQTVQPVCPERDLTSETFQAATVTSPALEPEPAVTVETISVKLLTSVRCRGGLKGDSTSTSPDTTGLNSQEQPVSDHWFSALNISEDATVFGHIAVMDLIYWKDTERTGMVLTGLVVGLLSLFQLSIITVVSTLSLAIMCFTISVRIYYQLLYILNWGDGVHPFKSYLDLDISLSGEQADHYMQKAIVLVLSTVDRFKRLFFVGNLFDSLKFLFLLYLITFLGDLCNGLTLLIIGVIAVFSLPLFYRQRQEQVDGFFAKIQAHVDNFKDFLKRLAQGGGPPPDPTPGGAKPKTQ